MRYGVKSLEVKRYSLAIDTRSLTKLDSTIRLLLNIDGIQINTQLGFDVLNINWMQLFLQQQVTPFIIKVKHEMRMHLELLFVQKRRRNGINAFFTKNLYFCVQMSMWYKTAQLCHNIVLRYNNLFKIKF